MKLRRNEMSIAARIAELEKELEELKGAMAKGYVAYGTSHSEYYIEDAHTVVEDTQGNLMGVVINYDVMKEYFKEME
jgi:hypothetical protein